MIFTESAERPGMPREQRNEKYDQLIVPYCRDCAENKNLPIKNLSGIDTCGMCGTPDAKIIGRMYRDEAEKLKVE